MAVEIADINELQAINSDKAGDYVLANDIDASATVNWNNGAGFDPIGGTSAPYFSGTLDGNGYIVTDLFINRPATTLVGMISRNTGTIKNIGVVDCNITGGNLTGAICGSNEGGELVGQCYSTGSVTGGEQVGGVSGRNWNGEIGNCWSGCAVHGSRYIGGLVGSNGNGHIEYSYCYGAVTGAQDVSGLSAFSNSNSVVVSSYWDTETSGRATSQGGTGKTTAEMQTVSTYTNWDFTDTWYMPNDDYPVLQTFYQVRDLAFTQQGQETYRLTWSGRSDTWYIYQDGLLVTETQVPFYDLDVLAGDTVQIDVLGLPTQEPALSFPGRVRLQWDAVDGADHYLIHEADDGYDYDYDAWQQVGRIDTPLQNASTYAWLSDHKPDGVYHYRVTAVSGLQAQSDPVYIQVTVAATPRMPDVDYNYEYGTLTVS